ncbi:MAG: ATP-binding protein [Anaerolineae bacterium]|nr:ATP-binding protein [Anaerolineae bacterium]
MPITPEIANIYIILLLIGTLIAISIVAFSLAHKDVPGASYLAVLNFFIALWLFLTVLDWSSATVAAKLFWNQLGYICVGYLPLSWLAFTLKYTQKKWFKPIYLIIPAIVPLFTLHLALNNRLWSSVTYSNTGPYIIQTVSFTQWIILPIAFAYLNNLAGTYVIIRALIQYPQKYQKQAIALIIGAVSPLALNIAYNTNLFQGINIDLTPLGFTVSSLALTWALFRYRLLNLAPYARDMLVDTMIDGLIVLDAEDNIIDLNPAAAKMTINSAKTFINIPVVQAFPALKTFNSTNEICLEVDGQSRYYDVQSSPLYNRASQTFEGRMLTLRDITSRKEVELQLVHSEEIFRSLIEQSYDGILLTDNQGQINIWNESMTRITGIHSRDIMGYTLWELIDRLKTGDIPGENHSDGLRDEYIKLLQKNLPRRDINIFFEQLIYTPDGEERYIQNITFPIYIGSSDILLGSVMHDITLSKQKEIENKRLYDEAKVLQKQAEAASEAKSQFLAVMSHELRTPMNAVLGMIQLMMDTHLSQKQMNYAEIIRSSGDALLAIINDILDYSKIESGKIELEERPFSLRNIVEESLDMVSHQAASKGLYLIYDISPDVPRIIRSDPTRLRQVLINLLGNAVKFTDKGEVVLTVKTVPSSCEDPSAQTGEMLCRILFSVRDTGIGIPENKLNRLFKTFSQVDQSTTRVYGGTGLGLVISKRLVEAMRGCIQVESGVNHGSTFSFDISVPALLSAEDMIEKDARSIAHGKTVLIYDENDTQRTVLTRIMHFLDMQVHACRCINDVSSLLNQADFALSLVLLDESSLHEGQMDYFDKVVLNGHTSPLILLSNPWFTRQDKRLFEKSKAVINKPVKYYLLLNVLQQILSGKAVHLDEIKKGDQRQAVIGLQHPLRILLVEDNLVNQKVSVSLMERLGYRISIANNGLEALKILRDHVFDVVFMDVQMAEMDGFEATRHIRNGWAFKDQPRIIALTAATALSDRTHCIEAGMDDYISKPIHLNELANILLTCQPISSFDARNYIVENTDEDQEALPSISLPVVESQVITDLLITLGYQKWPAIQESIRIFISESGKFISDLNESYREESIDKMHRLAHTLKSTSASVGALALSEQCKILDTKLKLILSNHQKNLFFDNLQGDIYLIQSEFMRACQELEKIHDKLPDMAVYLAEESNKTG